MPVPRLPEYERHWARILSDLPEQEGGEAQWRSDGLGHGRRQREREDARLLPPLRIACLSALLGHAGPLPHSRREPRRSRPIRAADADIHGARSCVGPARSGRAEIREDAADVKPRAFSSEVATVRVKKARQIRNPELRFDSIETEGALEWHGVEGPAQRRERRRFHEHIDM